MCLIMAVAELQWLVSFLVIYGADPSTPLRQKLKNRVYKPFNSKRVRKCINEPNIMDAFIMQAKCALILITTGQKSKAQISTVLTVQRNLLSKAI